MDLLDNVWHGALREPNMFVTEFYQHTLCASNPLEVSMIASFDKNIYSSVEA